MKKANVIILAGQSNAVGVGWVKYLPKSFKDDEIKLFKSGYEHILIDYSSHDKKSNGFVKTAINCTEISKDTLGPEVGIAKKLTEKYPDEEFFIIKCAFGGTNMCHDWRAPSSGVPFSEDLLPDPPKAIMNDPIARFEGWCYNALVRQMRESLDRLESMGYTPSIIAFLWMQGESDCSSPDTADPYFDRYGALLGDIKAAFGSYFSESCRFIDAAISEMWNNYDSMNARKKAFAEEHGHYFVDTVAEGLTTKYEPEDNPDTAHYDCASTVRLGEMFAEQIEL